MFLTHPLYHPDDVVSSLHVGLIIGGLPCVLVRRAPAGLFACTSAVPVAHFNGIIGACCSAAIRRLYYWFPKAFGFGAGSWALQPSGSG